MTSEYGVPRRHRVQRLVFPVLLVLISSTVYQIGAASPITYKVYVIDDASGEPVRGADVRVIRRATRIRDLYWETLALCETDENGSCSFTVQDGAYYILAILSDDPATPGWDYIPLFINLFAGSQGETSLSLKLQPAATIRVKGDTPFFESVEIPEITYTVVDPATSEALRVYDQALQYGGAKTTLNAYVGLPIDRVIVPAGIPVSVLAESSLRVGSSTLSRKFVLDPIGGFNLSKGQLLEVNLLEYALPSSLSAIKESIAQMGSLINEKEAGGFYLAVERQRLAVAKSSVSEGETLTGEGLYEAAYTRLRAAYVELENLKSWIAGMSQEASQSMLLLTGFAASSACILALILWEDNSRKALGTLVLFTPLAGLLYFLHPGSQMIDPSEFIRDAVASISVVLAIILLVPRVQIGGGTGGRVTLRNMAVPIFSMAKRNLMRRRLRMSLTLTSVILLASSFIALTSFTSGYGLVFTKTGQGTLQRAGVLVRDPAQPVEQELAPASGGPGVTPSQPLDPSFIGWFEARDEVSVVAPKYEAMPFRQYREGYHPLGYAAKFPIFGIMCIDPSAEAEATGIDDALVEGRYLRDDDVGVLISAKLRDRLGLNVGDSIPLRLMNTPLSPIVIGVLDDEMLESFKDLDGGSVLPLKIIEVERVELDGPDLIMEALAPCTAEETIIATLKAVSWLPGLTLSRLNVVVDKGIDLGNYVQMLALNRGVRAWASTTEGVYLAHLAPFFEGKGLPVAVPWVIVVLSVVMTMVSSYYERRRELVIYSAIGMNPRHLTGVFLAEAAVIGVAGGCLGYLLGLGWYKIIFTLTPTLQVKQKVSAFWSLAAIGFSLAAVLVGGLTALLNSTAITPSLRRRWEVTGSTDKTYNVYETPLPIRITEDELDPFKAFILGKLEEASTGLEMITQNIRESPTIISTKASWIVDFTYRSITLNIKGIYSRNRLIVRRDGGFFTVSLTSEGDEESAWKTGALLRQMLLDWSLTSKRLEGG
jgi:hypothetical protein